MGSLHRAAPAAGAATALLDAPRRRPTAAAARLRGLLLRNCHTSLRIYLKPAELLRPSGLRPSGLLRRSGGGSGHLDTQRVSAGSALERELAERGPSWVYGRVGLVGAVIAHRGRRAGWEAIRSRSGALLRAQRRERQSQQQSLAHCRPKVDALIRDRPHVAGGLAVFEHLSKRHRDRAAQIAEASAAFGRPDGFDLAGHDVTAWHGLNCRCDGNRPVEHVRRSQGGVVEHRSAPDAPGAGRRRAQPHAVDHERVRADRATAATVSRTAAAACGAAAARSLRAAQPTSWSKMRSTCSVGAAEVAGFGSPVSWRRCLPAETALSVLCSIASKAARR